MDASPSTNFTVQLRQERIRRNWRQQDLADQLGTSVVSVKRWEGGSQQPSAYFRVKLCALFGKSAEELGLLAEELQPQEKNAQAETSTLVESRTPSFSSGSSDPSDANTPPGENTVGLLSFLHQTPHSARTVTLEQQNRARMLRLLRRTYQSTLDDSLQGIAWMEMDLAEHPDAVRNATHLLQRLPERPERVLPDGTLILAIYDQAEGELLILGMPGAGKSTLLLHLAVQLVARAESDEAHPFPVIVPLSSWAVTRPMLDDWLLEQFARIYNVPRALAQQWVQQGRLLPLLDGLDEMEEAARPLCIAAINTYRAEQGTPLVVCSRSDEYYLSSTLQRLVLQNAVVVQPLTQELVDEAIHLGGSSLAALQEALTENLSLQELSRTPLMLNVLLLAYRGTTIQDLPHHPIALEQRIWTDYVERMVRQKGAERWSKQDLPIKRYPLERTCSWLAWLAQQMRMHNQSPFYAEYLQESWLPAREQRQARWLVVRLPAMLLGTLTSLLLSFFLISGVDPASLCQIGLVGGFLGWCLSEDQHENTNVMRGSLQRSFGASRYHVHHFHFPGAMLLALLSAVSVGLRLHSNTFYGLHYTVSDWFRDGAITGTCILVSGWLLSLRLAHLTPLPIRLPANRWPLLFRWVQTTHGRRALWTCMILGFGVTLNTGLMVELGPAPLMRLSSGLSPVVIIPLGMSLRPIYYGLSYAGTAFLVSSILEMQAGTVRLAERMRWTWRGLVRFRHLWNSLIVSLVNLCFFGLIYGLTSGLSSGLTSGLSSGLSSGLTYWLLLGLYQGMTQQPLEDQDRRRFNQGLHRSLQNGSLFSLISAGIITGIAALHYQPYYWLLLLFCTWLVMWATTGGLTILHHYLVRLLLARNHTFPWRAQAFLDDATARILLQRVGGGYRFMHRRLLDYFADQDSAATPTSAATHIATSARRPFERGC